MYLEREVYIKGTRKVSSIYGKKCVTCYYENKSPCDLCKG